MLLSLEKRIKKFDIDRVGLIRGDHNPEDALSKLNNKGRINIIFAPGVDDTPVEQWIMRRDPSSSGSNDRHSNDESSGECEIK